MPCPAFVLAETGYPKGVGGTARQAVRIDGVNGCGLSGTTNIPRLRKKRGRPGNPHGVIGYRDWPRLETSRMEWILTGEGEFFGAGFEAHEEASRSFFAAGVTMGLTLLAVGLMHSA